MEVLDLIPPQFGVLMPGIYVVDDEGIRALAGPFNLTWQALAWIEQTHPARKAAGRRRSDA